MKKINSSKPGAKLTQPQAKNWAEREFGTAELGDQRLNKRLITIAKFFTSNPTSSIPQACGSWKVTKATYRFFDNDRIKEKQIQVPHLIATEKRVINQRTVLAIQDTSQLDFTHHPSTKELGLLSDESHLGLFYHPTLLLTPEKIPLGIIDQQVWTRPPEDFGKRGQRKKRPISEKESQKWLTSLEETAKLQEKMSPVHFINIGDREADVFDLFLESKNLRQDILVRAAWNRCVEHPEKYLWDHMKQVPISGDITITVPRKKGQPHREAILSTRYDKISLKPPRHRRKEKGLRPVRVWAVWAHESDSPDGVEPISWMLLTTIPVHSFEEALEKVQWYTCRWQIEIFFKILKSGCRIEEIQLATAERIKRCLVLYAIIAWRVLFLTMVSRNIPKMPCDVLLELEEWQALYCFINQTKTLPSEVPTLMEATRMIAKLGGFLGRKHDGHPGSTVIWRGLQRLSDIASVWSLARAP